MTPKNSLTAHRIAAIGAALQAGPLCAHDLAPKVFLCYEHTRRYLRMMHELHLVHIAKWKLRAAGNQFRVACFSPGQHKDAPRPPALTGKQKQARSRARMYRDGDRYELHRAKDRARKRKLARDPLVAAIFGAPASREGRT